MTVMRRPFCTSRLQLMRLRPVGLVGNSISIAVGVLTVELTMAPTLHWWWGNAFHRVLLDTIGVTALWFLVALHEIAHGWFLTKRGPVELRLTPTFGSARPTMSDHISPASILAGPVANIGFGLLLQAAILNSPSSLPYIVILFGAWLAWTSIVIGIANLFPVFPLDGYRLLESLIDRSSSATVPLFRLVLNTIGFGLVLMGLIISVQHMRWVSVLVLLVALISATTPILNEVMVATGGSTAHAERRQEQ